MFRLPRAAPSPTVQGAGQNFSPVRNFPGASLSTTGNAEPSRMPPSSAEKAKTIKPTRYPVYMEEAPTKPGFGQSANSGAALWLLCAFILVLVIYPLSIGPAVILHQTHPAWRPAIELAYKPIVTLMERNPSIRALFTRYVEIFRLPPTTSASPPPPAQTNSPAAPGK
jgi:hypothetical protein